MNSSFKGFLAGILSAVAYGMNPFFALPLYGKGMSTYSVLFYRFTAASILLAIVMIAGKKSFSITKKQMIWMIACGILIACSSCTWYASFRVMDSGIGATIMFTYPVMVAAIMACCFHEKNSLGTVFAILFALAGVAVLSKPGSGTNVNLEGVVLVLISSLTYAVYIILVKVSPLKAVPPVTLTFYIILYTALSFLILLKGGTELQKIPGFMAAGCIAGIALIPSFISFFLMAVSVKYIGPTKTAILGALEPLTALIIGIVVFGEKFTLLMLAGIVLVLGSVICVVCWKHPAGKMKKA